jgi:hypothetical protein
MSLICESSALTREDEKQKKEMTYLYAPDDPTCWLFLVSIANTIDNRCCEPKVPF